MKTLSKILWVGLASTSLGNDIPNQIAASHVTEREYDGVKRRVVEYETGGQKVIYTPPAKWMIENEGRRFQKGAANWEIKILKKSPGEENTEAKAARVREEVRKMAPAASVDQIVCQENGRALGGNITSAQVRTSRDLITYLESDGELQVQVKLRTPLEDEESAREMIASLGNLEIRTEGSVLKQRREEERVAQEMVWHRERSQTASTADGKPIRGTIFAREEKREYLTAL